MKKILKEDGKKKETGEKMITKMMEMYLVAGNASEKEEGVVRNST